MRRYLTICAMLLASCGPDHFVETDNMVDPGLLQPRAGYTGPSPETQGALIAAAHAEQSGRLMCNADKSTISEIIGVTHD